MLNTKHTPGNWEIEAPANFANRRGLIANGIKHTVLEDYTGDEQAAANAKLIAAAPELLEAVKFMYDMLMDNSEGVKFIRLRAKDLATLAIKKATE